jgi:hypothetical protein
MKRVASSYEGLKTLLKRFEGYVDITQFLLSAIAVTLVIANEFVAKTYTLPYIDVSWPQFVVWVRAFTWMVFVFDFVMYGLASGRPWRYARTHLLELIICITWVPYYDATVFQHVSIGQFLTVDALTVIGSIVHTWMVGRWTVRRFSAHPQVVIGSAVLVLIATAAPILMKVEPETFKSLSDALWFCVQTIFTVGYGEIVPHSDLGRLVSTVLILAGVGTAWVFIALVTRIVQQRLMKEEDPVQKLTAKVDELVAENKATNALNRELLEELRKHNCGNKPPTGD